MPAANRLTADDIDPANLWTAIRGSLPMVIGLSLAAFALTFGALTQVAPRYQSEAQLTIDAKAGANPFSDPKQTQNANESTSSRMDKEAINTHIRSLMSPALATKIVSDLKLKDNVEFNSALGEIDMASKVMRIARLAGPRAGQTEQDRVLEAFTSRLDVYAARESRFIGIRFTSANPQLAADIPNAIAEAYRADLASRQVEETKDVQDALQPKIVQLSKDVSAAEIAVEQFRGKTDSFNTGAREKQTLNEQQLGELTNELSRAQAARSDSESRAKSALEMMKAGAGDAQPDVQKSALIQNLVQQRVRAERQIAEISATLLPGHPRMRQLNADLAGLKTQIHAEVAKIVDGLGKEAKVAADRETAVKKRLSELKVTVVNAGPDEAKLKMLVADAQSKRDELERLQAQYNVNKTRADSKAVPVEAKLISPASPSSVPVFPKKLPWAALVALATFILGLGMSILKATAMGARSGGSSRGPVSPGYSRSVPADADMAVAVAVAAGPSLGPAAPKMVKTLTPIEPVTPKAVEPRAAGIPAAGSNDELVAHIAERTPQRGGYRSLVAGQTDGVDGGAVAIALATGLAEAGHPSVLIEWSNGSASIARQLGLASAPGMAELVAGSATFEDVVTMVPGTECHFIPAGHALGEVPAALDPDQVNLVLDALDEAYAHIVVAGEHDAVRALFETIEGRFDAGIIVEDASLPVAALHDPEGTFLGFEVADIELLRITRVAAVAAAPAPKTVATRRLRDVAGVGQPQHPAE